MSNLPTIEEIEGQPGLRLFGLEALDALNAKAEALRIQADAIKKAVTGELTRRFGDSINAAYLREAKDTGAVHVQADGYDLLCERPKRVDWDQAALQRIGDEIAAAGDDVHEYVKVTYAVDERKYTAWPEFIRAKFAAARTVKPGAMTIKLAKLEGVA